MVPALDGDFTVADATN